MNHVRSFVSLIHWFYHDHHHVQFHMNRTRAIFDWIFGIPTHDTTTATAKTTTPSSPLYQLYYLQSPNVGLSDDAIAARRQREEASCKSVLRDLAPTYTTLSQVATFLYQHHDLYTAKKLVEKSMKTTTTTIETANATSEKNENDKHTSENHTTTAAATALLRASYGGSASL
jgi:hypothetical protein